LRLREIGLLAKHRTYHQRWDSEIARLSLPWLTWSECFLHTTRHACPTGLHKRKAQVGDARHMIAGNGKSRAAAQSESRRPELVRSAKSADLVYVNDRSPGITSTELSFVRWDEERSSLALSRRLLEI
jgi:hypothetical protein